MVRRKYSRAIKVWYLKKAKLERSFCILRASGYDRDDESCRVRMHTLPTACKNHNDSKRRSTGTASQKKLPCYE